MTDIEVLEQLLPYFTQIEITNHIKSERHCVNDKCSWIDKPKRVKTGTHKITDPQFSEAVKQLSKKVKPKGRHVGYTAPALKRLTRVFRLSDIATLTGANNSTLSTAIKKFGLKARRQKPTANPLDYSKEIIVIRNSFKPKEHDMKASKEMVIQQMLGQFGGKYGWEATDISGLSVRFC